MKGAHNMNTPKGKKSFVPPLYVRAPRLVKSEFVNYIFDFENKRGNKTTREQANQYFLTLQQQSRRAAKEGRKDGVWITHDFETGEWGGRETPFTVSGVDSRIQKGKHRDVLRGIEPCSREEMLEEIARRYKCDEERARSILGTCKHSEVLKYDKPTRTWRSWDADDPTEDDAVERPATAKQEEYWQRYSDMPPVTHNYYEPEKSEHLKWIQARNSELGEPCELAESEAIRMRVWNCSKDESKIPWKRQNGQIVGKTYVEPVVITDEISAKIEALELDQWNESSFFSTAASKLGIANDRAKLVMAKAFKLGLWKSGEVTGKDRRTGERKLISVWAGKTWWNKREAANKPEPKPEPVVVSTSEPKQDNNALLEAAAIKLKELRLTRNMAEVVEFIGKNSDASLKWPDVWQYARKNGYAFATSEGAFHGANHAPVRTSEPRPVVEPVKDEPKPEPMKQTPQPEPAEPSFEFTVIGRTEPDAALGDAEDTWIQPEPEDDAWLPPYEPDEEQLQPEEQYQVIDD
jgi:hypothetical protein